MIGRDQVTLGILAGGLGRRLGGVDKAFASYQRQPLFERCLHAAGPGFAQRLISHPSVDVRFSSHALVAVADSRPDHAGPLAGLESLLAACTSPWLLTVPVDAKTLPAVVFDRLLAGDEGPGRVIADADGLQPLVALWRVATTRPIVAQRLDAGQRDARGLVSSLALAVCDIDPLVLGNLNTPADFLEIDA